MLLLLFRRSYCRVPTGTPTRPVATAGRAYGQWYKRNHSFVFRLPPGVCKASATFTGTSGIHEFQFRSGFCQAVHIPWEDMDYDYNHDYYLLARERDRLGMGDFMISDRPFLVLQTSIILPARHISSEAPSLGVGGDMIRTNIDPLIIDTTSLDVRMAMVLRTVVKIYVGTGHILGLEGIVPHCGTNPLPQPLHLQDPLHHHTLPQCRKGHPLLNKGYPQWLGLSLGIYHPF